MDVTDMLHADWAVHANDGSGDYWHWFTGSPPKWKSYEPWPVRLYGDRSLFQGQREVYNSADTHGLIGNMTYNGARDRIYFFYVDIVGEQHVTMRQETIDLESINWWRDPVRIRDDWVNVAYHAGLDRWAVLFNCWDEQKEGWDVCMQLTDSADVDEVATLEKGPQVEYGLGLTDYFNDPNTHGVMEQYGFLKNEYGQIPGNTSPL